MHANEFIICRKKNDALKFQSLFLIFQTTMKTAKDKRKGNNVQFWDCLIESDENKT